MTCSRSLQVIPVLDLARGQVVRAVRGERAAYRPIVSALVAGSDPLAVAAALLPPAVPSGPAAPLYVADLDAIQGGAPQIDTLLRLLALREDVCLWLDAGLPGLAAGAALRAALGADGGRMRLVYGTESLAAGDAGLADDPDAILSLDCRLSRPLDPAGLWSRPELWPRTLVVMTLDRVGTAAGPDLSTFAELRARAPGRAWVGAGGVRDRADLQAAAEAGASGWLVASALHDGSLRRG